MAKLKTLQAHLSALVADLDAHPGTIGNLWKISVTGLGSQLLGLFGVPLVAGAPIAAGVVGISTFKVILKRDDT